MILTLFVTRHAAKRARLKAVKYTANTHKTNPFLNSSLTDQSRFAAMSPELAQFFKAEAEPVKLHSVLTEA